MNVSQTADTEFMRLLKIEDPERYERLIKNIRQDAPGPMSEDDALSSFQLGMPTGQHKFAVFAGKTKSPARADLDRLLQVGSITEYTTALVAFAGSR
jgi:hypothetical protein